MFACLQPLLTCRCLIVLLAKLSRLSGGRVSCDLWHRRKVESQCVFFKIDSLVDHPVTLCVVFFQRSMCWGDRPTPGALAAHCRSFEMPRSRTVQFSRSFVLSCVVMCSIVEWVAWICLCIGAFKTSVNRFLLQGWLPTVSSFSSTLFFHFSFSRDLR